MTKVDLIHAIALRADISKVQAARALDALSIEVAETLATTGKSLVPGIGKLEVAHRKARVGRNPQTGDAVEIPARRAPKFKAAKALKDALN